MILLLFILGVFPVMGQEVVSVTSGVTTNRYIVSNTVETKAWKRTALMATKDNELLDPSGTVASAADSEAVAQTANLAEEMSVNAIEASRAAMQSLFSVTNQTYESAVHISIGIPRDNQANLTSWVASERSDATYDYQTVRFSQLLTSPPVRHVEYRYVKAVERSVDGFEEVRAVVRSEWLGVWDRNSFTHECRMIRPVKLSETPAVYRTVRSDVIGGTEGFSFGSAVVRVNGAISFTGSLTNKTDGTVLSFKNGVLRDGED